MIKGCALGLALILLLLLGAAHASDAAGRTPAADESDMEVVLVTGVAKGPALWKVSSGDHEMWILGEISPFPRKWKWRSKQFEDLLGSSQELLLDFSGYWGMDEGNSTALTKASMLTDGKTLKDVITPELHARVQAVGKKFGKPALEQWRPFSVTNRLVSSVMKTRDLTAFSARFAAARLGEFRRRKITFFAVPELPFEERLRNWQQGANVVCLERLLDAIDDGGAGVQQLANAWAVGDIRALRELVPAYSFSRDGFRSGDCAAAMHGGEQKARDYKTERTQAWLAEARRALENNRSTLAVILMSELFDADGYLAALRAAGYEIVEPK